MQAFNLICQAVLRSLDLASDHQCVIDSLPLPAVRFYLVPSSGGDGSACGDLWQSSFQETNYFRLQIASAHHPQQADPGF
jgi:hypothetical protein